MTRLDNAGFEFKTKIGNDKSSFEWLHLSSDEDASLATLRGLNLPKVAMEGLLADETRPRSEELESGVLIYLRGINLNTKAPPDDMVSLRLWVSNNQIISTTKKGRSLLSIKEVKAAIEQHEKVKNIGDFLCLLLDKVTDKICDEVESYENALDVIENILTEQSGEIDRQEIINIRRQSAHIKRFIMPQKEALESLPFCFSHLTNMHTFKIKETSERISRYLENIDIIRERSVLIQEEIRNSIAEKQSERMYVLSIVTAIFLPLSFLTGVFGMNVAGLPGTDATYAFSALVGTMIVISVSILAIMKKSHWF